MDLYTVIRHYADGAVCLRTKAGNSSKAGSGSAALGNETIGRPAPSETGGSSMKKSDKKIIEKATAILEKEEKKVEGMLILEKRT